MTAPRWLDEDEMTAWKAFLVVSARVPELLDRDLQARFGRTAAEYEVLVHLSDAPERRRRMADLAERALQSRSRLTHTIDRLEGLGLVERVQCADDRRGTWAVLTTEGMSQLEAMAPAHVAGVRRWLLDPLIGDQVVALGDALGAVASALDEETPAEG